MRRFVFEPHRISLLLRQSLLDQSLRLVSLNYGPASAYKVEYQHDGRYYEQQVNQTAPDVTNQPEQPQHQKNYKNCPKHSFPPFLELNNFAPRQTPEAAQRINPFA